MSRHGERDKNIKVARFRIHWSVSRRSVGGGGDTPLLFINNLDVMDALPQCRQLASEAISALVEGWGAGWSTEADASFGRAGALEFSIDLPFTIQRVVTLCTNLTKRLSIVREPSSLTLSRSLSSDFLSANHMYFKRFLHCSIVKMCSY